MKNPLTIHSDSSESLHYNKENFPLYTHKDELSNYDYRALVHWHPDLEFIYIVKGTMDYFVNGKTIRMKQGDGIFVNGKTIRMKQGDGIFVNSQRLHYGFSNEHNECIFIALVISPDIFIHITPSAKDYMNKKFGLKNTDYIPLYHHVLWQKEIIDLIIFIHNKMYEDNFRPLLIISKAIGLIDMIGEHISDYKENNHNSYDQNIFLEITSYISKNYDKKITIDLICKQVGISRSIPSSQKTKMTMRNYSQDLTVK